jgi:hypothetical protein
MSVTMPTVRRAPGFITPRHTGGAGLGGSVYDMPGATHLALATVGGGDDEPEIWARIQGRKVLVNVVLQTGGSGDEVVAECDPAWLGELHPGAVVLLGLVNADPNNSYILARVDIDSDGVPDEVCGVSTGAAIAADIDVTPEPIVPLPLWSWVRTRDGRLYALETGAGGDLLLHSGASVELKAAGQVHVSGPMVVGAGLATPPIGAMAGVEDVADGTVPGVPGVPDPPTPHANPTTPPYAGDADAVVRAKDQIQSGMAVDPAFWLHAAAVDTFLVAVSSLNPATIAAAKLIFDAVPKPTSVTSAAVTASQALRAKDLAP